MEILSLKSHYQLVCLSFLDLLKGGCFPYYNSQSKSVMIHDFSLPFASPLWWFSCPKVLGRSDSTVRFRRSKHVDLYQSGGGIHSREPAIPVLTRHSALSDDESRHSTYSFSGLFSHKGYAKANPCWIHTKGFCLKGLHPCQKLHRLHLAKQSEYCTSKTNSLQSVTTVISRKSPKHRGASPLHHNAARSSRKFTVLQTCCSL